MAPRTAYEKTLTTRELFLHRALKQTVFDKECWIRTGSTNQGGYPLMFWKGQPRLVHKLSYAFFYGCWPSTKWDIHHLCRERRCWNPDHLQLSTRQGHRDLEAEDRRFCVRGHDTWLVGRYKSGHCYECSKQDTQRRYYLLRELRH